MPSELLPQDGERIGDGDHLALRLNRRIGDGSHQVEAPVGKGARGFECGELLVGVATELGLGLGRVVGCGLQHCEEWSVRLCSHGGFTGLWRKRMGVEPTRDRLAAPPGFEVRTPHRGRFSSRRRMVGVCGGAEKIEPMLVHAPPVAPA